MNWLFSKVHGNLTNWSNWSEYEESDGFIARFRNRSCTNPIPYNNGMKCTGELLVEDEIFKEGIIFNETHGGLNQEKYLTPFLGLAPISFESTVVPPNSRNF